MPEALPLLIAGPLLRNVTSSHMGFWLITSRPCRFRVLLRPPEGDPQVHEPAHSDCLSLQAGERCYIHQISLSATSLLPEGQRWSYEIHAMDADSDIWQGLTDGLGYGGQNSPGVMLKTALDRLLHGSCRKPHHGEPDGLLQVDRVLQSSYDNPDDCPSLLLFSGDQVYVDDVAGPMLAATHQVIDHLGLFDESIDEATVTNLAQLRESPHCFYERHQLLPENADNQALVERFFGGARKPVFTTANAYNHLITLSEMLALYVLNWSEVMWSFVDWEAARSGVPERHHKRFDAELPAIKEFAANLGRVRRALANVPTYMIFDDHDVTDDWNLSRGWEEAAYGHPVSRRIIGNALLAYLLCQGWGNQPEAFRSLREPLQNAFPGAGLGDTRPLIETLLDWPDWHYVLATKPRVVVLDTRTHRWRSESSASRPSGLMDWESLSDMQLQLLGQEAVILVSPAPVFGVKLIEVIQRIFTWFGKALMVDAENWMAHPGAANVMLNIFEHRRTPPQFIILSGDVHYSFAFDVRLRSRASEQRILQVTASGIRNAFPPRLLSWFDRLDRWLFASRSPLNLLTKRRRLRIRRRRPDQGPLVGLFNHSGIGELRLAETVETTQVAVLASDGRTVRFKPCKTTPVEPRDRMPVSGPVRRR